MCTDHLCRVSNNNPQKHSHPIAPFLSHCLYAFPQFTIPFPSHLHKPSQIVMIYSRSFTMSRSRPNLHHLICTIILVIACHSVGVQGAVIGNPQVYQYNTFQYRVVMLLYLERYPKILLARDTMDRQGKQPCSRVTLCGSLRPKNITAAATAMRNHNTPLCT